MLFKYKTNEIVESLTKEYLDKISTAHNREVLQALLTGAIEKINILLGSKHTKHMSNILKLLDEIINSENIAIDPQVEEKIAMGLSELYRKNNRGTDKIPGLANSLVFLAHILREHPAPFKEDFFPNLDERQAKLHIKIIAVLLEKHLRELNEAIKIFADEEKKEKETPEKNRSLRQMLFGDSVVKKRLKSPVSPKNKEAPAI